MYGKQNVAEDAKPQAAHSYDPVPRTSLQRTPGGFAPQAKSRDRDAVSAKRTPS